MQIENFDDLLVVLKSKTIQNVGDWEDDLFENFPELRKIEHNIVATDLFVDKHRWYETSLTVIKMFDRFLGIRHVSNVFSESMEYSDCYVNLKFFEMKEVIKTTYNFI